MLYFDEGSTGATFMAQSTKNIEAEVLQLPYGERARIALHILNSLEQEQSPSSQAAVERAWIEESEKRLSAYRRGEMKAYPVEDVIVELEASTK
jgi:putative addiction module component (TIGR02574 family)